jgi:hypothetical protein
MTSSTQKVWKNSVILRNLKLKSFDEKRLFLLIFVENIKLWLNFPLLETLLSPFESAISLHGWLQASMGMFTWVIVPVLLEFTDHDQRDWNSASIFKEISFSKEILVSKRKI